MANSVPCPNCGSVCDASQPDVDGTVRCGQCQAVVTLDNAPRGTLQPTLTFGAATGTPPPATKTDAEAIGRFEIRSRLGSGSFGTVYRAFDPLLEREVALKVPHTRVVQADEGKDRLLREAKAAARLHHPNIVPLYEAGADGDQYYIASAYIEGRTLQTAVAGARRACRQAAPAVLQIADALAYAHTAGIVHRDVKPENVMLDTQGSPLLMDFGLARLQQSDHRLTHDGTVMGTPAYMSPEQAAGKQDQIGPATDQYSLGVVLYELLSGRLPFDGPVATVIAQVINEEPASPRSINGRIPRDLETICLKAMAKQPRGRFVDCREMGDDLRRWLDGQPIRARRLGPVERFSRWCRRNPAVAALSATAVVLLVAVAVAASVAYFFADQAYVQEAAARQHAETLRQEAEAAAIREAGLRREAQAARDEAQRLAASEAELRIKTQQEREKAEQSLYFSWIMLSQQNWRANHLVSAERRLDRCPPELRHWEWGYLKRICHLGLRQFGGRSDAAQGEAVRSVSIAAGAGKVVLVAEQGPVEIWDVELGQLVRSLPADDKPVARAAASPDGKRIVSGYFDGTLRLSDAASGEQLASFGPQPLDVIGQHPITALAYHHDGTRIVSGLRSGTLKVWDAAGKELLTLYERSRPAFGTSKAVWGAVFSHDGKHVASAHRDGTVKIWDITTQDPPRVLPSRGKDAVCVTFSPDDKLIVAGYWDGTIRVFDAADATEIRTLPAHTNVVNDVAFSPDGRWFATAGEDTAVILFDATTFETRTFRGHRDFVKAVQFTSDGRQVVSAAASGLVKVWDAAMDTNGEVTLRGHTDAVSTVATGPNGKRVVSGSYDGSVLAWDVATGNQQVLIEAGGSPVNAVAFHGDGRRIAVASDRAIVQIVDVDGIEAPRELLGHAKQVLCAAFSHDGARLLTGSEDTTAKIFDVATGEEVLSIDQHGGPVTCVAYSPDGRWIVTGGTDAVARVFDAATGELRYTFDGHTERITGLAVSPDGAWVVSGSLDKQVKLWQPAPDGRVIDLPGHPEVVTSVAVSGDGRRILSAGVDGAIKLYAAASGQELLTLHGHTNAVTTLAFAPGEGVPPWIASGGEDGTVKLWRAATSP